MCCFRLHFSDFNVLFFQKKNKNVLQFTFPKKNNLLCRKREKSNLSREKIPDPLWFVQKGIKRDLKEL